MTKSILGKLNIHEYTDGKFSIRRSSVEVGFGGLLKELYYTLTCRQYRVCEQGKIDFDNNRAITCKRKRCPVKTWRLITH